MAHDLEMHPELATISLKRDNADVAAGWNTFASSIGRGPGRRAQPTIRRIGQVSEAGREELFKR
jgi:hypothetical protein